MKLSPNRISDFQTHILSWYERNERDLPWRSTSDPYAILVSEVMSQQTQITRVVPKYLTWMQTFPTIEDLAQASVASVLTHWSGLGYNRRALNLQKAAQSLVNENKGTWPTSPLELEKLPGIGKYTASAIACFAFNAQIPVIDTNVRKVVITEFLSKSEYRNSKSETKEANVKIKKRVDISYFDIRTSNFSEKEIEEVAWQILPIGKAKAWNQALMDYAGAVLKKEKIPVPKQSKFLGSNRWYRGGVLKLLTKQGSTSISELAKLWDKDHENVDKEWFETLLVTLEKEGFIKREGETITLK